MAPGVQTRDSSGKAEPKKQTQQGENRSLNRTDALVSQPRGFLSVMAAQAITGFEAADHAEEHT